MIVKTLPLQATQLLLIISICKVNGISFRHDDASSGYVTTEGITSSLFAPIPTQQDVLPTIDHATTTDYDIANFNYGPLSNSIDSIEAYIGGNDGRLLKQYQVFEDHGEGDIHNDLHQQQQQQQEFLFQSPKSLSDFFYPTAHISSQLLYPDPSFPFLSGKGLQYDSFSTNPPPVKSQLTKNHGPIALGTVFRLIYFSYIKI